MLKNALFLYFIFSFTLLFSQNTTTLSIQMKHGLMYINNNTGSYFTVSITGDSIKLTDYENIYIADKQLIKLNATPISPKNLNMRFDTDD